MHVATAWLLPVALQHHDIIDGLRRVWERRAIFLYDFLSHRPINLYSVRRSTVSRSRRRMSLATIRSPLMRRRELIAGFSIRWVDNPANLAAPTFTRPKTWNGASDLPLGGNRRGVRGSLSTVTTTNRGHSTVFDTAKVGRRIESSCAPRAITRNLHTANNHAFHQAFPQESTVVAVQDT